MTDTEPTSTVPPVKSQQQQTGDYELQDEMTREASVSSADALELEQQTEKCQSKLSVLSVWLIMQDM